MSKLTDLEFQSPLFMRNVGCTRFCVVLLESDGVAKLGEQRFSYMTSFENIQYPVVNQHGNGTSHEMHLKTSSMFAILVYQNVGKKDQEKTIISLLNCCSSVLNHHISTKPSIGFFRFRPANLNKTLGLNLVSAGTRVPTLQGMDITDSKSCFCKGCFGSPPPQNLGSRSPQADLPKKKVL